MSFGTLTLFILFYFFDPREVIADLAHAHMHYVLVGVAICMLALLVRTLKWKLILHHVGIHISYWRLLEVYTISYWFSTFLPGSIGGDLYKMHDISRASSKILRPVATVILERLTGLLSLLAVAVTTMIFYRDHLLFPGWMIYTSIGFSTIITICLLISMLYFGPLWSLVSGTFPFLKRFLKPAKAENLIEVSKELRSNPRLFIEAFLMGVLVQLLVLTSFYVMALAISREISPIYFFSLFPLIEIASMVPISINGIGIKEGLMVFSLEYNHITPAVSISTGLLFRLVSMALGLAGGALLMLRKSSGWKVAAAPPRT